MKVKNIVFSGFAAAILMGVAADASAEVQVATKGYIDSLDSVMLVPTGHVVTGVTQEDGKVSSLTTMELDQAISETSTHDKAPTSKAVYDYVTSNDTTYTGSGYVSIDTNNNITVNDVTNVGTDINANDTGLTTGKAVSEYVTTAVNGVEYSGDDTYINVDNDNNEIELTNITSEAAGITSTSTALTTGKAVYEYVAANDDNTTYTGSGYVSIDGNNDITVTNITSEAAGITGSSTALTTGKAVYDYVTANDDDTTYTGSGYVSIDGDNNITVTNVTNDADGIIAGNTELTTANAVFEYVDELTGGVLPQGCDTGNCSLVKLNGTLQWVELTTPLE